MKQSAAFAAIRQIASLGYAGELALPVLLKAIRDIVPCEKAGFMWLDEQYDAVDVFDPDLILPPDVTRLYLEKFHNRQENKEIPSNRQLMTRLGSDRSAAIPKFQDSVLLNTILRHGGNRHFLRLAIRDGTKPVGMFYLFRTFGSPDFTREEELRLSRAAPWLAHALVPRVGVASEERMVDDDNGLVIVDAKGAVQFFSHGARNLLHRAAGTPVNSETVAGSLDWAQALVGRLLQALAAADIGRAEQVPAPALTLRNAAGVFVLRAYWMESAATGGPRNAAIQIQRQVPLPLRLMASPRLRGLPPREQQACLLLAQGLSSSEIAKRMGISRNGAVYHMRSAYTRFRISRKEELVDVLMAPPD